jgi:hypothetical protein
MKSFISSRILPSLRQRPSSRSQLHFQRYFLSSSSPASTHDDNTNVLYERDESRNSLPRASFLVSSGNLIYWIWYVFDFVPAVNTSTVPDLHIDPAYGFGGLGLSVLIHSVFTLYPMSLISKLAYKPNTTSSQQGDQILVWKHTLPMVRASKIPLTVPLGEITMDKASPDTAKVLNECNGNLQKYQGHLGIRVNDGYFPLLLEIRKPTEIDYPQLLLEVLLDPERLKQSKRRSEKSQMNSKDKKGRKQRRHRG